MGSKLYVGNLAWSVTDASLREAFENFGGIREAKVVTDRESGQSRGFGFVTFEVAADAMVAMNGMNGVSLAGRNLRVSKAEEKSTRGPSRGGDNRGGYSSDRNGGGYSSDRDNRGGYSSDRDNRGGNRSRSEW